VLSLVLALAIYPGIFAAPSPAGKPIRAFILAGQSNMVGWGDSTKLPDELRRGNDRVLMFADGQWQPLRPHAPVIDLMRRVGLTEFSFGPEISFGHEIAQAWPDETIGIIKLAFGGTSLLAWKPDWSKESADRVGQGNWGSLYRKLLEKISQAQESRKIEIIGFLWLQGGGDMKNVDVAQEYLTNLKAFVAAVRKDTGVADLPLVYGSSRSRDPGFDLPDDLSKFEPQVVTGTYPAAQWVLKAQFDAQREIPRSRLVILREVETHPRNVHYNTEGQLATGRIFAAAFLDQFQRRDGRAE
jgi:hypothetical protein